jgi:hypothetical protein
MAGFRANGCSQTSRHPVEADSDRNIGYSKNLVFLAEIAADLSLSSTGLNPLATPCIQ